MATTVEPSTRRTMPRVVAILSPLVARLLRAGVPFGPNVLLTVRGRTTGRFRTTPVALSRHGTNRYLLSPLGEPHWVRNLRAAGEAVITQRGRSEAVAAIELSPDAAAPILKATLEEALRHRATRWLIGYFDTPPEAPLAQFAEEAARHPVFRLEGRNAVASAE